jgi:hypothetical protein
MFMCVVNLKTVNKLDLTWKQSFLIERCLKLCAFVVEGCGVVPEVEAPEGSGFDG